MGLGVQLRSAAWTIDALNHCPAARARSIRRCGIWMCRKIARQPASGNVHSVALFRATLGRSFVKRARAVGNRFERIGEERR